MQTQNISNEQKLTNLAVNIQNFSFEDNFAKIYFVANLGNKEEIQKMLNEIGITEIFHKHTDMNGNNTLGHSFVLDYEHSKQKKIVDDLEHRYIRMKALKTLFNNGGFQLNDAEKQYFDKESNRIAALVLSKTKSK